jgi:hypothetical protein
LLTSQEPEPRAVLPETSTPSPQPCVLSQEALHQEQLLKFFIGLRLLGEKKRERFLAYMATLQERSVNGETAAQKEGQE